MYKSTSTNYYISAVFFCIAAPRAWNSIPADLRATLNTATFKKNLKTFLFRESYSTF